MTTKHILLLLSAGLALTFGCKKETDVGTPSPAQPVSALAALFQQNVADATQQFNLNAAAGGTITGAQGTQLFFGPNAFVHADGSTVTGSVQVRLVEALSIADMIWLNKHTVGNDAGTERLLRSGGELKIAAIQGSETLRIVDNGATIRVPTSSMDPDMDAFVGTEDSDGSIVWDPMDSTTVTNDPDTLGTGYYVFNLDSLQWINCDYFASYPSTTEPTATTPAGQSNDSTRLWIAFPTENAVMEMVPLEAQTFSTWQVVPVGMYAVVVGIYRNGANYYSAFQPVTITSGMNVPLTFSPTTLAQFQTTLNAI